MTAAPRTLLVLLLLAVPVGAAGQDAASFLTVHLVVDSMAVDHGEWVVRQRAPKATTPILPDLLNLEPQTLALSADAVLELSHMRSAAAGFIEEFGDYAVWVTLSAEGTQRLARVTAAMVGGSLAVVRDGVVVYEAVIRGGIPRADRIPVYLTASRSDAAALAARINRALSPGR